MLSRNLSLLRQQEIDGYVFAEPYAHRKVVEEMHEIAYYKRIGEQREGYAEQREEERG